jgi:hypothetical protein
MKIKRIVLASMFLVSGLAIAPAQVKLSFNPEKGAKYEYQTEMIQNNKTHVMGQEVPVEMEISSNYLMEIVDKTSDEIHVKFTYQEITYIISSPMMKMGYDSKNPIENPSDMDNMFGKMLGNLLGASVMVVFAPDGSAKSVTGMDAIAENMAGTVVNDGQIATQMAAQMKQTFSDVSMKSSFEQLFRIYPDNPVRAGNKWEIESETTINNMNTGFKTNYTLKNVSRNMATIAVESVIEMNPGAGMDGKLTGTQTGTINMNTQTGLPETGNMTQNMKGSVSTQGMDMQMEMVTQIKSSIKEVK